MHTASASICALACALAACNGASGSQTLPQLEPIQVDAQGGTSFLLGEQSTLTLQQLLARGTGQLGLPEGDSLAITRDTTEGSTRYVRLIQTHEKARIAGAEYFLILHGDVVFGGYGRFFKGPFPSTAPAVTEAEARTALARVIGTASLEPGVLELATDPPGDRALTWSYLVGTLPVAVDASTGQVRGASAISIHQASVSALSISHIGVADLLPVQAATAPSYYNGNVKLTVQVDPSKLAPDNLLLGENSSPWSIQVLDADYQATIDAGAEIYSPFTQASPDGLLPSISVSAQWATEQTLTYFYQKYNREGIDGAAGKPLPLTLNTNYCAVSCSLLNPPSYDYNRARWWGSGLLTFGSGDGVTTGPQVAIDTVARELARGVEQYTVGNYTGFNATGQAGAIAQGIADAFAWQVRLFALADSSPILGSTDQLTTAGQRNLSAPQSLQQPDSLGGPDWNANGDTDPVAAAFNGSVISHWFYLIANGGGQILGMGADPAGSLLYRALAIFGLSPSAMFSDLRYATTLAAAQTYLNDSQEVITVTNAWNTIGVGAAYSDPLGFTPADGSQTVPPHATFTWIPRPGETKWRVEIDTTPLLNSPALQTLYPTGTPTAVADLALNQTYYWRVTGYWTNGGEWGTPRLVHALYTNVTAPVMNVPVNVSPFAGATLTWSATNGSGSYQVELSETTAFLSDVWDPTGPSQATGPLVANATYYAKVRAVSPASESPPWASAWSAIISFQTTLMPAVVATDYGGADVSAFGVDICWNAMPGATQYQIQGGTSVSYILGYKGFEYITPVLRSHSVPGNQTCYTELFSNGQYNQDYWYYSVTAIGSDGVTASAPSAIHSGYVSWLPTLTETSNWGFPSAPYLPTIMAPSGTGANNFEVFVERVPGALTYYVDYYVANSLGVGQPITSGSYITSQVAIVDSQPTQPWWSWQQINLKPPAFTELAATHMVEQDHWAVLYAVRAMSGTYSGMQTAAQGLIVLPDAPTMAAYTLPSAGFGYLEYFKMTATSPIVEYQNFVSRNPQSCTNTPGVSEATTSGAAQLSVSWSLGNGYEPPFYPVFANSFEYMQNYVWAFPPAFSSYGTTLRGVEVMDPFWDPNGRAGVYEQPDLNNAYFDRRIRVNLPAWVHAAAVPSLDALTWSGCAAMIGDDAWAYPDWNYCNGSQCVLDSTITSSSPITY